MAKLWLDDERPAPDGWLHVKSAHEAIKALQDNQAATGEDIITDVSLDHDLGHDVVGNGYTVASFIEQGAMEGTLRPMRLTVHSANPVGRERMKAALRNAYKFWGV